MLICFFLYIFTNATGRLHIIVTIIKSKQIYETPFQMAVKFELVFNSVPAEVGKGV